jgi:DNA repair protein RecN (Recombination protein N)
MCITHLPQLAAYGEQHYRVVKALQDGRTHVEVQPLADQKRLAELAQMLGPISEGTLQSAEEILKIVHHQKKPGKWRTNRNKLSAIVISEISATIEM